jgi:hypothetical protein
MAKKSAKRRSSPAADKHSRPPFLKTVMKRLFRLFEEDLPVTTYDKGKPEVEVQETRHHQAALETLCDGRTSRAARVPTVALLVPNPKTTVVRVEIGGRMVGTLKPADGKRLEKQLTKAGVWPCALRVAALIQGGRRKKNGEEEEFTVKVALPPKPEKKPKVESGPEAGGEAPED